ncbi:hypothetical protein SELMODRAFT_421634 [Selaginella moellendorffii]|uniref:tRNA (guanine(46)-N(7))-methyltransferase n=1 Tax=Selaginella moellendorffii TaxID=88036 RepID=D8SFV9_SELML|nr:uncharacterized protein LOC9635267 [Selaginella moellendorffii]EFJ16904.1 hypothetical protein SELMODRAFT_421634 [Selaginella moellendorffii]|eukprot:XP_002982236.1 uncharacterized protein LOC9635267 [Selaginella moellendorffii]
MPLWKRNVGWRWIPSASIWRGRCDPLGELAPHVDEVVPILWGPIDNFTPRIVTRRQVDNLISQQFQELNVKECWRKIGVYKCKHQRIKRPHYMDVVYPPVYSMAFEDPEKPLHVDVGSGDGKMIMLLAKRNPHINYLGLDKSPKRSEISTRFQEVLGLKNLHFVCCNATISFDTILATYPGPLEFISIMCPDPHIYSIYYRIRMVNKDLVERFMRCLAPGGKILFQTEFEAVAGYLKKYLEKHLGTYITEVDKGNTFVYDEDGWLLMNPLGVRSETEIDAVAHGQKVFRRFYQRLDTEYVKPVAQAELLAIDFESPNPDKQLSPRESKIYRWLESPRIEKRRRPRKMCNMLRRLPEGVARDIILNSETYPRGWFLRLLRNPRLKKIKKKPFETRPRILPIHKRPLEIVREDIG